MLNSGHLSSSRLLAAIANVEERTRVSAVRLFPEEQRSHLEHDDARRCGQHKLSGLLNAQQRRHDDVSALRDVRGPAMAVARHALKAHTVDDVDAPKTLMNQSA